MVKLVDLNMADFIILKVLLHENPSYAQRVSKLSGLTYSYAHKRVAFLATINLLELVDENHKRIRKIILTEKGRKVANLLCLVENELRGDSFD